jgi:hypothetical protein
VVVVFLSVTPELLLYLQSGRRRNEMSDVKVHNNTIITPVENIPPPRTVLQQRSSMLTRKREKRR